MQASSRPNKPPAIPGMAPARAHTPHIPGRAGQGIKVVVPVLVKGIAGAADVPEDAVVQHAGRVCNGKNNGAFRRGFRKRAGRDVQGPGPSRYNEVCTGGSQPALRGALGGRAGVRLNIVGPSNDIVLQPSYSAAHAVASIPPQPHNHATHLAPPTSVSLPVHFVTGVAHQILNRNMPHIRSRAAKRVTVPVECVGWRWQ